MTMKRRDFLRSCIGMTLGGSLLYGAIGSRRADAAEVDDYKALVCVYLAGGNDSFNMIVPATATAHADYAAVRPGLAVARDDLVALTGVGYGMHPQAAALASPFNSGDLAVVANCGNLVAPLTAAQYRAGGVALPPQLFSHSDQRRLWMAGDATGASEDGWCGRLADMLVAQNVPASPAINFNMGGINLLQSGHRSDQYSLTRQGNGYVTLHGSKNNSDAKRTFGAYRSLAEQAKPASHPLIAEYGRIQLASLAAVESVKQALDAAPALMTTFSYDDEQKFGRDLEVVARMISARAGLGAKRQIFFIRLGGWDTHAGQAADHPRLLETLATGLDEFSRALVEMGVSSQVTTFTASEFGRTLSANGDGTDHGWGGHHLVMGGAVAGGKIYGTMPEWKLDGADDAGKGRIVPSTSNDQFGATLAKWFGIADGELDTLFPNLKNFTQRDLGFMRL